MNKPDTKPIFPESEEAAKFVTGVSGWVDRHGRFWGNDERMARFCGATHKHCECGAVIEQRSYCEVCAKKKNSDQYKMLEKKVWDETTPIYSQTNDQYFFSKDDFFDFCHDQQIGSDELTDLSDELELFICEPNYLSEIESDHWVDDLPEDGDLPAEVEAALEVLNAVIRKAGPVSWSPGKFAAIVDSGMRKP